MHSEYAPNLRQQRRLDVEKREHVYQYSNGDMSSSHVEPSLRARKVPERREYHNSIGRMGAMEEDSDSPSSEGFNNRSRSHHDRMQIRRRLKQKSKIPGHVKWTKWMHSEWKNDTVAVIAEFIGTTMFLFFAFGGTVTANIGAGSTADDTTAGSNTGFNPATLLYISFSFSFSLIVNA